MKQIGLVILILMLAGLACSLSPGDLPDADHLATSIAGTVEAVGGNAETIATSVAATLEAQLNPSPAQEDPTATFEDIYQTGTVNGHVCYPSEYIPEMNLYLENVDTLEVTKIPIPENQPEFSAPVPPGTYIAYAWLPNFSYGGAYTGENNSVLPFEVTTGSDTNDIAVCDWYGSVSDVPYPPEADNFLGTITGSLGYPSEFIPPMVVVATNVDTNQYYFVLTDMNQGEYEITHLLPGTYHVVAYPRGEGFESSDFGGGYSEFVPCGLLATCTDHSLIDVDVFAGTTTNGIDPVDFYAPQNAFPPNPVN